MAVGNGDHRSLPQHVKRLLDIDNGGKGLVLVCNNLLFTEEHFIPGFKNLAIAIVTTELELFGLAYSFAEDLPYRLRHKQLRTIRSRLTDYITRMSIKNGGSGIVTRREVRAIMAYLKELSSGDAYHAITGLAELHTTVFDNRPAVYEDLGKSLASNLKLRLSSLKEHPDKPDDGPQVDD
jgi:hypothetical protein